MLGNAAGIKNLENYFIAGVLHDIGKLLFFEFVEDEYEEVLKLVEEKNSLIRDAEREVMGIDHAQAGRLLADRWKLPVSIKNAIYHHHEGDIYGRPDLLAATVHIANITARMLELGYAGDDLVPKPNERAWKILNLPPKTFTKMTGFIVRNFEEAVKLVLSN
jgi:HD-like signal output (HDOD) protein